MASRIFQMRSVFVLVSIVLVLSVMPANAQRGAAPAAPPTPRAAAPIDITGTWTPMITEDWRHRMITPKKGDYESVPLSAEGRRVADTWDPAKDEAAGQQCKSYGAAAIMRVAGRVRISWENDTTIKIETEAGTQTRRLTFGSLQAALAQPPAGQPSLQGTSVAAWENILGGRGNVPRTGNLKVVTRNLSPGYLRKNGVPYGTNAIVTEWYDVVALPDGTPLLVIDTEVIDPENLNAGFVTSTHFKKLAADAPFTPEPCSAR